MRATQLTLKSPLAEKNWTMVEAESQPISPYECIMSASDRPAKGLVADYSIFLRALLNNPRAVSSPTPSSRTLAAAMAAQVDPHIPGTLVDLGAGNGAITEALLTGGFSPDRIVAIEYEPILAAALHRRCPGIRVFCDDAFRFEGLLTSAETICAVVCSLPILHFPHHLRQSFLSRALARQGSDQRYIQLSYSFTSPVTPAEPDVAVAGSVVWRNFPPAHVWTYRRVRLRADPS